MILVSGEKCNWVPLFDIFSSLYCKVHACNKNAKSVFQFFPFFLVDIVSGKVNKIVVWQVPLTENLTQFFEQAQMCMANNGRHFTPIHVGLLKYLMVAMFTALELMILPYVETFCV